MCLTIFTSIFFPHKAQNTRPDIVIATNGVKLFPFVPIYGAHSVVFANFIIKLITLTLSTSFIFLNY